jgi:hypothetical protein
MIVRDGFFTSCGRCRGPMRFAMAWGEDAPAGRRCDGRSMRSIADAANATSAPGRRSGAGNARRPAPVAARPTGVVHNYNFFACTEGRHGVTVNQLGVEQSALCARIFIYSLLAPDRSTNSAVVGCSGHQIQAGALGVRGLSQELIDWRVSQRGSGRVSKRGVVCENGQGS